MLLKFFKNYFPSVLIITLLIGVLILLKPFILHNLSLQAGENIPPLLGLIVKLVEEKWVRILVLVLIFLFSANYLVRLNLKYYFIEERTYLPALFFLLLSGVAFYKTGFQPAVLTLPFILIILDNIFNSHHENVKLSSFYDSGLLLAFGSLIWWNFIYFILIVVIGIILLNSFSFRKFFVLLTGILTIYFITAFYYFFFESLESLSSLFFQMFEGDPFTGDFHYSIQYFGYFLGVVCLMAFFNLLMRLNLKKIIARKYISVLIAWFFIVLLIFFIIPGFKFQIIYYLLVPVSFLLADYFEHLKSKWMGEIIFTLMLGFIVFIIIAYPQ